ncbi:hypothetical protein [Natrinema gelatinilyticum]|uniref:hypothetical protein n=1 Tax=Natrinema gelatinilyticum TaxID=2961571 RepID=UPI0020C49D2B|nr:hypothetical protein [Natrinema gelatinilyticum]
MNERRNRQVSAVVGVFLFLVGGSGVVLLGARVIQTPVLLGQMGLLGLAGLFDIVAATDTRLTDRWAWYRWNGAGSILLGLSFPLGLVGSGWAFFLLTSAGGLSLVVMGIDMLAFHGRYTREERLDRDSG